MSGRAVPKRLLFRRCIDDRLKSNDCFATAGDFPTYIRDAFDLMLDEGRAGSPTLLSVGLHDRLIGRPGRAAGLVGLLRHMRRHEDVWFCRGIDVAQH